MASVPQCQSRDLLREDLPGAVSGMAEEPPDRQVDHRAASPDRWIVDAPLVAAVHPLRGLPAPRAARLIVLGPGPDMHPVAVGGYRLDTHASQMREQVPKLHSGHTA